MDNACPHHGGRWGRARGVAHIAPARPVEHRNEPRIDRIGLAGNWRSERDSIHTVRTRKQPSKWPAADAQSGLGAWVDRGLAKVYVKYITYVHFG